MTTTHTQAHTPTSKTTHVQITIHENGHQVDTINIDYHNGQPYILQLVTQDGTDADILRITGDA